MDLILKPSDEDVKYTVTVKTASEFITTLKDADLLNEWNTPSRVLLIKWYSMLQKGVIILSPKYLKATIFPNSAKLHIKKTKSK